MVKSGGDRFLLMLLAATVVAALALVVLATAGASIQPVNAALLFVLLTLLVSANFGIRIGLLAAVASNLALIFFFFDPVFEFWVYNPQHQAALIISLLVSTIGGSLLEKARSNAEAARRGQAQAEALLALNRALSGETDADSLLHIVCREAVRTLEASGAAVLVQANGEWRVVASSGDAAADRPPEITNGTPSPREVLSPLAAAGRDLGVLRIDNARAATPTMIVAFAREAALAMTQRTAESEAADAEALRRADELKTALISSISHDIKTPLASIRGAATSLLDASVDWSDEDRLAFLHTVNSQSELLTAMIGDLLDLNRLNTGSLRPLLADESTAQLVEDAVELARPQLEGRSLTVDVPDIQIPTDASLIRHALANLLANAALHSTPTGAIRVFGSASDENVRLCVEDEGPGISPGDRELTFKPFFKNRSNGTGLGLAIVKGFVSLCNGTVALECEGGHNRFVVMLPRTRTEEVSLA